MNETLRLRRGFFALICLATAALIALPAWGDVVAKNLIKETVGLDGIDWETKVQYRSATLVVTGPGGFQMEQTFAPGDSLFLDFGAVTKDYAPSGQYYYELKFAPDVGAADRALAKQARDVGEDVEFLAPTMPSASGSFAVSDGVVVDRSLTEETDALKLLHAANVYIDGSLCVGNDCVNNSAFGFDTIRLDENNLRIKFQDTSVAAAFPTNDWQIVINDSSNGGSNYFAVEDFSAGRQVFRVFAGAPSNSLVVNSSGRIGIRTASPSVELHVVDGDTPTLRLEQDASSGFTPQTWDLASNETNFFVRDVTNGSRLPLRIRPGAATSSIDVDANGNTRFNHSSTALGRVHARAANTTEDIFVAEGAAAGGPARFALVNTSTGTGTAGIRWIFNATNAETFNISDQEANGTPGTSGTEFSLDRSGNLTLLGNLELSSGGACIQIRDTDDAGNTMCTALNGVLTCAIGSCP